MHGHHPGSLPEALPRPAIRDGDQNRRGDYQERSLTRAKTHRKGEGASGKAK